MPPQPQPARWVEVSLTVDDPELVDPLTETLARFTPQPVALEYASPRVDAGNHIVDLGPATVRAYIPIAGEGDWEGVRRRVEEALWHLGQIHPLPPARFRVLREEDWAQAWKKAYKPLPVGRRLVIVPAWLENPHPDRVPVFIEPGMAFGTGMHPTTRLVLLEVERLAPGQARVLDVGCGSGILSLAALRLGAAQALGLDVDPVAVEVARANAARNGLADRFSARVGSLEALQPGQVPFTTAGLVLANILAPVLVELLRSGLAAAVEPGGHVVLSGILADQAAGVAEAARQAGLRVVRQQREGDWVALTAQRPSPRPADPSRRSPRSAVCFWLPAYVA